MDQGCTTKLIAVLVWVQLFMVLVKCSFDPFMDSKLFSIKWHGPLDLNSEEVDQLGDRHVLITTNHQEHYRCILPDTLKQSENEASSYKGPTAEELMKPLFQQIHCSYRIESYWTYELCHGKHLKQYHETKEQGSDPKIQEYYLGFGNQHEPIQDSMSISSEGKPSIPVRVVEGVELPFYEVTMGDGTKCDLTGQPRKARILYVCQPEGWGEIYELKESSTCEYEIIVFTSHLCSHPKFRPKGQPVNEIRCHAMFGSPLKPMELSQAEIEARYLHEAGQEFLVKESSTEGQDARKRPKFFRKGTTKGDLDGAKSQQEAQSQLGAVTDKQTLRAFLSGSQCLSGGTGWWKHEVCFGSFAKQFHGERGRETNIYLGHWNKEKHILWLKDNPQKRPRAADVRKHVSLLYSDGDVCDLTGRPRNCEVRLKCLQDNKNPHAVVLSLMEPEPCQYLLTVESALFCPILKDADEYGLFENVEI